MVSVLSATFHDLNLNGPVPVGCSMPYAGYLIESALPVTSLALYCWSACGLWIENEGSISAAGILLETRVKARSTVVASFAAHDLNRLGGSSVLSLAAKPPMTSCQ